MDTSTYTSKLRTEQPDAPIGSLAIHAFGGAVWDFVRELGVAYDQDHTTTGETMMSGIVPTWDELDLDPQLAFAHIAGERFAIEAVGLVESTVKAIALVDALGSVTAAAESLDIQV